MSDKLTANEVINKLIEATENRDHIERKQWLEISQDLNFLRDPEIRLLNGMRQEVAKMKKELLDNNPKMSVARALIEVEASDLYRLFKDQEGRLDVIAEHIRIAKQSANENW